MTSGPRCLDGAEIAILTDRDPEALDLIRHDAAHVMAEAVKELYPGAKVTIGPAIEYGFYYDFEFPDEVAITEADLGRIEEAMRIHIEADEPFTRRDLAVAEAIEIFRDPGETYKVELIEDLVRDQGVETVSLYRNGRFEDLCRGPHGPATGRIKAIKLSSVAGAYWRGDERRKMLTRIYGTAFFSKKSSRRTWSGSRRPNPRPPPPRSPARPLHAARGGAGDALLAAQRDHPAAADRGRGAGPAAQARLSGDRHPARCSTRSSGIAPGTGTTTAIRCTSWRSMSGALRCGR